MNNWQRAVCALAGFVIATEFFWVAVQASAMWLELIGVVGCVATVAVVMCLLLRSSDKK